MKKKVKAVKPMVQDARIAEKLYFVQFGYVRRHSRVLYVPLDPVTVRLHGIKKGDIVKYQLLELRRGPTEEIVENDPGELESEK